jgi:hypothetical protein
LAHLPLFFPLLGIYLSLEIKNVLGNLIWKFTILLLSPVLHVHCHARDYPFYQTNQAHWLCRTCTAMYMTNPLPTVLRLHSLLFHLYHQESTSLGSVACCLQRDFISAPFSLICPRPSVWLATLNASLMDLVLPSVPGP